MNKNSVLEKLRVRRLAVIQKRSVEESFEGKKCLIQTEWMERKKDLIVICIKMVVKGKRRNQNT